MKYKSILFFLGINFLIVSFFCLLNILYSIYFEFFFGIKSYLITFVISLALGTLFYYLGRNYGKDIDLPEQIFTILLSFILIPALISIPYYLSIYDINLLNAYFPCMNFDIAHLFFLVLLSGIPFFSFLASSTASRFS